MVMKQQIAQLKDEIQYKNQQIDNYKRHGKVAKIQELEIYNQNLLDENVRLKNQILELRKEIIYQTNSNDQNESLNEKLNQKTTQIKTLQKKLEHFENFDSIKQTKIDELMKKEYQQQRIIQAQKIQITNLELDIKNIKSELQFNQDQFQENMIEIKPKPKKDFTQINKQNLGKSEYHYEYKLKNSPTQFQNLEKTTKNKLDRLMFIIQYLRVL